MAYTLTPEQVESITDPERAFSTERLLPAWEDIPEEFKRGNVYTQLASAIFNGTAMPDCEIELFEGFKAEGINECIRAHLRSFGPSHEHKIAGVGYMVACTCKMVPDEVQGEGAA